MKLLLSVIVLLLIQIYLMIKAIYSIKYKNIEKIKLYNGLGIANCVISYIVLFIIN